MRGLIIAAVALVALSGCFGLPEGAADFGDEVTVRYVAIDADSGEVYTGPLATMQTYDIGGVVHYDGQRLETAVRQSFDDLPGHLAAWFEDGSVMHRSISVDLLEAQLGNIRSAPGLAGAGDGCGPAGGRPVVVDGQQHVVHDSVRSCLEAVASDAQAAAAGSNDTALAQGANAAATLADPRGQYTLTAVPVDRVVEDVVKRYPGALGASQRFAMGGGGSGLGFAFERAVVGRQVNDTFVHRDHDGATRGFIQERTIDRQQNPLDLTFTESTDNLPPVAENGTQRPAQEGDDLPTGVTGIVAHVVSISGGTATLRFDFESGIPVNLGHGVEAEYRHDGERLWLQLDPVEGEVFTVRATPQPDPFGLEAGSYRTEGATQDSIIYGYAPTQNTDLLTAPLDVYVEVVDVERGADEVPTENYGKRTSPVLPHLHDGQRQADGHDH